MISQKRILIVTILSMVTCCLGFVPSSFRLSDSSVLDRSTGHVRRTPMALNVRNGNGEEQKGNNLIASNLLAASIAIAAATTTNPMPSSAYVESDYASDAVQAVIKELKDASGNVEQTFKAYEDVAAIITEGKGVGGMINYQGVELERGYIADEDTTIYNPGLSLLTESEKERIVEAVINVRKDGLAKGQWNDDNELGYDFLREKLDPYHMKEISGFLGFVPFYGAILYLLVLGVQQLARDLFPIAYIVGVIAFFGPIVALIAIGP